MPLFFPYTQGLPETADPPFRKTAPTTGDHRPWPLGGDAVRINHHKANDAGEVRQKTLQHGIHLPGNDNGLRDARKNVGPKDGVGRCWKMVTQVWPHLDTPGTDMKYMWLKVVGFHRQEGQLLQIIWFPPQYGQRMSTWNINKPRQPTNARSKLIAFKTWDKSWHISEVNSSFCEKKSEEKSICCLVKYEHGVPGGKFGFYYIIKRYAVRNNMHDFGVCVWNPLTGKNHYPTYGLR